MKILFVLRPDSFEKFGGDTLQIEKYKQYLSAKKHICYYTTSIKPDLTCDPDIVVVTNIDTDCIFKIQLKYLTEYKNKRFKIICHPIHHPKTWTYSIVNAYSSIKSYKFSYFSELFILSFNKRSILKFLISNFFNPINLFLLFTIIFSFGKNNLHLIDKFVFLSDNERIFFENDFNIEINDYCIIPNGSEPHIRSDCNKKNGIIILGRIEPRKNSVSLARLLSGTEFNVDFYGGINSFYKFFISEFFNIINNSKNIRYMGSVTNENVLKIIDEYKLLILSSYAEVFPLVEAEALRAKVNVLSTTNTTNIGIYKTNSIKYIHPDDLSVSIINNHYFNEFNDVELISWDDAVRKLETYYYECIS